MTHVCTLSPDPFVIRVHATLTDFISIYAGSIARRARPNHSRLLPNVTMPARGRSGQTVELLSRPAEVPPALRDGRATAVPRRKDARQCGHLRVYCALCLRPQIRK